MLAICVAVLAPSARASQPSFTVTPSPAHARAFAPPADAARFTFSVTAEPIEVVVARYRERWPPQDSGSWTIAQGPAAEAFDSAAMFDRARLSRLYGGRHPRLARGPIVVEGTEFVVLLMSPYPEADLSGLNQGTFVMTVSSEVGPKRVPTVQALPRARP